MGNLKSPKHESDCSFWHTLDGIDELDFAIDRGKGTTLYQLPMVTLQIECWQKLSAQVLHNTKYVTLNYANYIQWHQFFIKNEYCF